MIIFGCQYGWFMPRARKPLDEKSIAISFSLPFAMERMIEEQLTGNMGRSEWIVDAIKMKMENQKIRNEIKKGIKDTKLIEDFVMKCKNL